MHSDLRRAGNLSRLRFKIEDALTYYPPKEGYSPAQTFKKLEEEFSRDIEGDDHSSVWDAETPSEGSEDISLDEDEPVAAIGEGHKALKALMPFRDKLISMTQVMKLEKTLSCLLGRKALPRYPTALALQHFTFKEIRYVVRTRDLKGLKCVRAGPYTMPLTRNGLTYLSKMNTLNQYIMNRLYLLQYVQGSQKKILWNYLWVTFARNVLRFTSTEGRKKIISNFYRVTRIWSYHPRSQKG